MNAIPTPEGHAHEPAASPNPNVQAWDAPGMRHLYRGFFAGGMAIALTLGAVWGAWLLMRIGLRGSFTAVGIHEVNAHGHAQIFGWVGLFIMGFGYHMFPRFWGVPLAWPHLVRGVLIAMIAGIALRAGFQPFVPAAGWTALPAMAGTLIEIGAIGLFIAALLVTRRRSPRPLLPADVYVLSALAWFLVQAVYGAGYFWLTAAAPDRDALLAIVAAGQPALRDLQIHGFILLMVLGVSQRVLPGLFGFDAPGPRRSLIVLAALQLAITGETVGLILMRSAGHAWAGLWYSAVLVLAVGTAVLVAGFRLHRPPRRPGRSVKFVRAAYAWLAVSMVMLVALPAYQFAFLPAWAPASPAVETGFSHAYYGAVRHAITVGFISLMIMGIAARIVPGFRGHSVHTLPGLWLPFVLVNTGCAMRVGFQTLTDLSATAFPIAGISGLLEVVGLALWGAHIARLMWTRPDAQPRQARAAPHSAALNPLASS